MPQDGVYRGNLGAKGCVGAGGNAAQYSAKWAINKGPYSGQYSDWACAAVLWHSRELTSTEYLSVEWWLKQVRNRAQAQWPARCTTHCRRPHTRRFRPVRPLPGVLRSRRPSAAAAATTSLM